MESWGEKVSFLLKVQLRSIAAPASVCPSHLANGAQVLTPLPVLPDPPRHQHRHPSAADHPPSLVAQPAMWTAAPVCAFPKAPADGVLVPQHPPQPCQLAPSKHHLQMVGLWSRRAFPKIHLAPPLVCPGTLKKFDFWVWSQPFWI